MVSKVAVIALVVIVAAPILLGYGLNFNEVTESDYRETTDSINVTQMLKSDTAYGFTYGNSYTNNTNFGLAGYSMPMMPISLTTWKTPRYASIYTTAFWLSSATV